MIFNFNSLISKLTFDKRDDQQENETNESNGTNGQGYSKLTIRKQHN